MSGIDKIQVPLVKCCLKGDNKAARAEATDDGPYECIPQLTFVVGGINLKSNRVRMQWVSGLISQDW